MNKRFKFFLVNDLGKKKNLVVSARDSTHAREMIGENYPNWKISMFWPVWP